MIDDLRLALFDFDGTLCDSAATIISTLQAAFAHYDLPPPSDSDIRGQIGASLMPIVLSFVDNNEKQATDIFHTYREIYGRGIAGEDITAPPLFSGARDALSELQKAGWLTAIITNKGRRGLNHGIDNNGISRLIDGSICIDEVPAKPAPDMALEMMKRLGVDAKNTVLVGDTIIDAGCAENAGIAFVGVDWGYHETTALQAAGAAAILKDFEGLPDILGHVLEQGKSAKIGSGA